MAVSFSGGNVGELATAVVRLIESETLRTRLGSRAREVAAREHTWMHNAQRVIEAYQDLTG
jgi:glycosyltransferase involved in cell wall biosynthesis